jgi:hypothetical protein
MEAMIDSRPNTEQGPTAGQLDKTCRGRCCNSFRGDVPQLRGRGVGATDRPLACLSQSSLVEA